MDKPTIHHYQCGYHLDQYPFECNCGVSGPRHKMMDLLPADRPPTDEEYAKFLPSLAEYHPGGHT